MTIKIIDYGSGNLHSVLKAFEHCAAPLGLSAELTSDASVLTEASHIVLPGVGAFGDCVAGLRALPGMWDALNEAVINRKTPFFGICVGMQMMCARGLEHGEHEGLGWIKSDVVPLDNCQEPAEAADPIYRAQSARKFAAEKLKIPHMGWNTLSIRQPHPVLTNLEENPHVYFVHSYHAECADENHILATTDYGGPITACIGRDNLLGTQFHPEKSGETGLQIIRQFLEWGTRA